MSKQFIAILFIDKEPNHKIDQNSASGEDVSVGVGAFTGWTEVSALREKMSTETKQL